MTRGPAGVRVGPTKTYLNQVYIFKNSWFKYVLEKNILAHNKHTCNQMCLYCMHFIILFSVFCLAQACVGSSVFLLKQLFLLKHIFWLKHVSAQTRPHCQHVHCVGVVGGCGRAVVTKVSKPPRGSRRETDLDVQVCLRILTHMQLDDSFNEIVNESICICSNSVVVYM